MLVVTVMTVAEMRAENAAGSVRGVVRDATAVLSGADLSLLNQDTAVTKGTSTNAAGESVFARIPAGVYTVGATVAGFKTGESKDLRAAHQVSPRSIWYLKWATSWSRSIGWPVADHRARQCVVYDHRPDGAAVAHQPGRNPFMLATTARQ